MDDVIRKLRDLLVGANLTEGEAKRIVRDSGIDAQAAWWTTDPGSFWQAVLDRAHTAWSMENLFAAADPVFGKSPAWKTAKENYCAAYRNISQPPFGEDERVASVDFTLYEKRLNVLKEALDNIQPSIFCDSRIRVTRLDAANKALLSVDPIIKTLNSAARTRVSSLCAMNYSG